MSLNLKSIFYSDINNFNYTDVSNLEKFELFLSNSNFSKYSDTVTELEDILLKSSEVEVKSFERMLNLCGGFLIDQFLSKKTLSDIELKLYKIIYLFFKNKIKDIRMWSGRPEVITNEVLEEFNKEALIKRETAFKRNNTFVSSPGDLASAFIYSDWLQSKIKSLYSNVTSSGYGTYIYYEYEGSHVKPHVDVGEFIVNVLLVLSHSIDNIKNYNSFTMTFDENIEPTIHRLEPGEILIFPAGSIFHSRIPVETDEKVTILTSGFKIS